MGQLLFKKCFWDAIRSGAKRTTIRRWSAARLRAGQHAYAFGLGWLHIDAIDSISLEQLTDLDAQADGFATLAELQQTLLEIYPDHPIDGRQWFRIAFRVEKKRGKTKLRERSAKLRERSAELRESSTELSEGCTEPSEGCTEPSGSSANLRQCSVKRRQRSTSSRR